MRRFLLLIMSLVCCYGACLSAGEVSEQEALRKELDDDGYSADSQEAYYFRTGTASGIQPEAVVRSDAGRQWFDLQGRRLQKQPAEKGVYIVNGRKVIVN